MIRVVGVSIGQRSASGSDGTGCVVLGLKGQTGASSAVFVRSWGGEVREGANGSGRHCVDGKGWV